MGLLLILCLSTQWTQLVQSEAWVDKTPWMLWTLWLNGLS